MPTHAELAGKLLSDAAAFFRTLASQNAAVEKDMNGNAMVFEKMSGMIVSEPQGGTDEARYSKMAARLLREAGAFFRTIGEHNAPLAEQMNENAGVFERIADLLEKNPLGILD